MHFKCLYQTVNKEICHWINRTCPVVYLSDIHLWFHTGYLKNLLSCIIVRIRGYVYKVLGRNSAILLHLYGYDAKSKILIFL